MRRRITTIERLERIARTALLGGYGFLSELPDGTGFRREVVLRCEMDCERPFQITLYAARPVSVFSASEKKRVRPLTVVVWSRCRKCDPCRKRRAMFWQARATFEWSNAPHNVFGTLTTSPAYDAETDAVARLELWERGVDFDTMSNIEQFRARVGVAGRDITKWLKRLREGDVSRGKPDIRYLLIAEAHASGRTSDVKRGRPHWHVLLHEQSKDQRLVLPDEWARKPSGEVATDKYGNPYVAEGAFLKRQWQEIGFSSFAMCRSPQAAAYLCKYLTKQESNVRVRNSLRYGGDAVKTDKEAYPLASAMNVLEENSTAPKEVGKTSSESGNATVSIDPIEDEWSWIA